MSQEKPKVDVASLEVIKSIKDIQIKNRFVN